MLIQKQYVPTAQWVEARSVNVAPTLPGVIASVPLRPNLVHRQLYACLNWVNIANNFVIAWVRFYLNRTNVFELQTMYGTFASGGLVTTATAPTYALGMPPVWTWAQGREQTYFVGTAGVTNGITPIDLNLEADRADFCVDRFTLATNIDFYFGVHSEIAV